MRASVSFTKGSRIGGKGKDLGDDALRAAQPSTLPEAAETHYTLQEAAAELGVDVTELQKAIRANHLPCTRHFGRHLVTPGDLELYRQRTQTLPPENSELLE